MATGRSLWRLIWVSVTLALEVALLVNGNSESDALYKLKQSLTDPDGVLNSWDPSLLNPCTWFHIECTQDSNNVIRVDLGNSNLSGNLVPELGTLENLQYLELFKNHITGTIPVELGNLKNLKSLDLYDNNLSGSIPTSLGNLKSLVFLRINNNMLTGPIPKELEGASSLSVMDFSNNDFCGPIPVNGPFKQAPLSSFANNFRLSIPGGIQGPGC